jgi:hypothetical protein
MTAPGCSAGTFDLEVIDPVGIEGRIVHESAGLDRAESAQPLEESVVEAGDGAEVPVLRGGKVDFRQEDAVRAESQVQTAEPDEALEEQGGADDQHHRERQLRDDEPTP